MSLGACIPELLASGKIRKADADKADRAYKRHFQALKGSMGDAAAAAEATTRALNELDYAAKLRKRQAGLMVVKQQKLDARVKAAVDKGVQPHRALTDRLRRVEIATERMTNRAHETMLDFIQHHRRTLLGKVRDKTGLTDFVNERHGKSTGNATAKSFSDAVGEAFERARLAFNREGGDIATREDYGLPHRYDPLKVRRANPEEFRADFLRETAPERMVDPLTGGKFTPERLNEFIAAAYKNISTNGLSEIGGAGGFASRALANRRSDPRFFVFKDGEAWLRIHEKYGDGNPFEVVMSHVHGMARDTAFMAELGPNPEATWRRAMERADGMAANSSETRTGVVNGTSAAQFHADRMWRYMNGDLTVPVLAEGDGISDVYHRDGLAAIRPHNVIASAKRGTVAGLHGLRDVLSAALLGTAQITSIVDVATNVAARKYNALPAWRGLMGYMQQLNPLDAGHRRHAVYLLAGARDATHSMSGLARFFGETSGPRWSQVLADGVMRVTLMNKWFEAGRRSFIADYFRQMGYERHLTYDQLPVMRQATFERHGITPEDWQAIRSADVNKFRGVDYVDWHRIADSHPEVADKLVDAVLREARSAVIETDAESQSITRWGRPGTLVGEVGANIVQFKSFPVALLMDQARRMAEISARHGGGFKGGAMAAKYGVSFVAGLTMLGAVSLQLKQIAKGQDMLDPTTPEFWWKAFTQGGGFGVLSDLLASVVSTDRVGGLADYIGGPVVSFTDDAAKLGQSLVHKDPETGERGKDFGNQASRFLRRYTPGTTIWYLRAALDRMLWDELQERMDPDYGEHQQMVADSAARRGSPYFWQPGQMMPDRAPTVAPAPQQ